MTFVVDGVEVELLGSRGGVSDYQVRLPVTTMAPGGYARERIVPLRFTVDWREIPDGARTVDVLSGVVRDLTDELAAA